MKFIFTLFVLFQFISPAAIAGEPDYYVSQIPDSLKKNANSVIRVYETTFRVDADYKAVNTVLYAITLLNSRALDEAELRVIYDKHSSVNYLKFRIFNGSGEDITHSFKTLEVTDESATPGGTLYSDSRCKVVSPLLAQYPVTIEYSFEVKSQVIFNYPAWSPITATNMSLQAAKFTLITPKSQKPRIKAVYLVPEATVSSDDQNNSYTWKISNIKAIDIEPFSPPYYELIPNLLIAPDHVSYDEYDDVFNTWMDFGKFLTYLIDGRDQLPAETILKVKEMVKDCPDKRSKVKKMYEYMQHRTRYVGVQIGIGGWQPIPADYVDKKGYGDCKGLVNYTKALLKTIGIESYYTLVKAGNNSTPVITDFPGNQFNHVILCVPDNRDTIWLECTSQLNAFGFLGSFTDNRIALVLHDNGASLVRTIVYDENKNTSDRKISIVLDEEGDASVDVFTVNKAIQSEEIEDVINESPDDQRKDFLKHVGYSDCTINSLKFTLNGDFIPVSSTQATLFVPAYASKSGNRIFIPLVTPDRFIAVPQNTVARVNDVVIRKAFSDRDSIQISPPAGFSSEFIPGKQVIESKFGKYTLTVELIGGQLYSYRSMVLYADRYKAKDYSDFIAFLKKISKADQSKVVLAEQK